MVWDKHGRLIHQRYTGMLAGCREQLDPLHWAYPQREQMRKNLRREKAMYRALRDHIALLSHRER